MFAWKGRNRCREKIIIINEFGFSRSVDYGTAGGPGNRRSPDRAVIRLKPILSGVENRQTEQTTYSNRTQGPRRFVR